MRTNYLLLNNESNEEFYSDDKPFILYLTQISMYSMEGFPTMISGLIVQVNRMIITIYFYNMKAPTADRHSFTINS